MEYLFDQAGKPLSMPPNEESGDGGEAEIGEEGEVIDEEFDESFPRD